MIRNIRMLQHSTARQHQTKISRVTAFPTKLQVCQADSDQPAHALNLIRVFAVHAVGRQRRIWSDCADTQSDLSLRCCVPALMFPQGIAERRKLRQICISALSDQIFIQYFLRCPVILMADCKDPSQITRWRRLIWHALSTWCPILMVYNWHAALINWHLAQREKIYILIYACKAKIKVIMCIHAVRLELFGQPLTRLCGCVY